MLLKIKLFVLSIVLLPAAASAQVSEKGKIITIKGDTIECLIQIDKTRYSDEVRYKQKIEDPFTRLPLSQLYRIEVRGRVFENVFLTKRNLVGHKVYSTKLCLCMVDGFVKLYKESMAILYHGGEALMDERVKPSGKSVFYIAKGNEKAQEIYPKFFVKQSKKTFKEYESIVRQIQEQKYCYQDLVKIVEDCNERYYQNLLERY